MKNANPTGKAAVRMPACTYVVTWRWSFDPGNEPDKTEEVRATTATRAASKVMKGLKEEYENAPKDVRIMSVWRDEK